MLGDLGLGEESDLPGRLRVAREKLAERERVLHETRATLNVLRSEAEKLAIEESRCYEELFQLRTSMSDTLQRAAATADDDLADALMSLILWRREEDTLTLSNIAKEADLATDESVTLNASLGAHRVTAAAEFKELAFERQRLRGILTRQLKDLDRYRREYEELSARTHGAALKHARELFGVS